MFNFSCPHLYTNTTFTKTLEKGWERVKILALHNDCCLPIGRPIDIHEDEKGLFLSAKISDTAMGRDVKTLLKDGVLNELSIGYDPVIFDYDENGIRHLREVELWEVSPVIWAMNQEATITDYKSAGKKSTGSRKTKVKLHKRKQERTTKKEEIEIYF